MFTLRNKAQMTKAIETAKRSHPKVKALAIGHYLVRGSAGNFYAVTMHRQGAHKAIDCGCVAGQYGTPCYHSAGALAVHMGLIRMRRTDTAAAILSPAQKGAERVGSFTIRKGKNLRQF